MRVLWPWAGLVAPLAYVTYLEAGRWPGVLVLVAARALVRARERRVLAANGMLVLEVAFLATLGAGILVAATTGPAWAGVVVAAAGQAAVTYAAVDVWRPRGRAVPARRPVAQRR